MTERKKKNQKWRKPRHRVFHVLGYPISYLIAKWHYHADIVRFREKTKRPYFIVYNHQTAFDQCFVGLLFRDPLYYVASEDIFSNGWISSLLRYAFAPIPIQKATMDVRAIINCVKVTKEGGSIAIAPEGNRTYSGHTCDIKPTIAPLARKLGLPVVCVRIEGGYGAEPRWGGKIRKGKMRVAVSRVMEPEEYATMTDDVLFEQIQNELSVNEGKADATFVSSRPAEYLERAIYVCPDCGLSSFYSQGDVCTCKTCGRAVRYLPTKELEGIDKPFPYRFVGKWYDAQEAFIRRLDLSAYTDKPMYEDIVNFFRVRLYRSKQRIARSATLALFGNRVEVRADGDVTVFPFSEIRGMAVLGHNKLNFYHKDDAYQVKADKRFNALKFVNIYYHFKGEGTDGEFLGI